MISGSLKAKSGVSPSDVFYHFGTSGMSVAAATGVTHPLGFSSYTQLLFFFPGDLYA